MAADVPLVCAASTKWEIYLKRKEILAFFFLTFIFCINANAQQDSLKEMSVIQLRNAIANDTSLVILDVRNPNELSGPLGCIDGVISIPVQDLENRVSELKKFRNKNIAVICRSGKRSAKATLLLIKNGFNAINVIGGMIKYRESENKD